MSYLQAIENSAWVDWFLTSFWGFPVFIALHSVGMAFVVGLSFIATLRYLGFLEDISIVVINKLISIAWLGFIINFITGTFLLLSRVSEYLFDLTFLIKMGLVVLAAIGLRLMHQDYKADARNRPVPRRRFVPVLTMVCWFGAITAGRWIAYLSGLYA